MILILKNNGDEKQKYTNQGGYMKNEYSKMEKNNKIKKLNFINSTATLSPNTPKRKFNPPPEIGSVFANFSSRKSSSIIASKLSHTPKGRKPFPLSNPLIAPNTNSYASSIGAKKGISELWYKKLPQLGTVAIRIKSFDQLTPLEIYNILKLRQDTFILEQNIMYGDIDGQDPHSLHVWCETSASNTFLAYLRIVPLKEKTEVSIGRVLTIPDARKRGIANHLMKRSIEFVKTQYPHHPLKLTAREELCPFYERLGFEKTGPLFFYPENNPIPLSPMVYIKKCPDRINKTERAWT